MPAGYDSTTQRYPVVYFFRGHESEWFNPSNTTTGKMLKDVEDSLVANHLDGKMILVGANTIGTAPSWVYAPGVNMLRPDLTTDPGIGTDKKSADKNSEIYIWITMFVCITISVYVSINLNRPILPGEHLLLIGTLIIVTGIIIRFIAITQLGRFFTVDVTIRNDHQLVQSGFYKYLRHPSYTGSLLSFFGFGISLNNWFSLAIVFLPTLFAFIHRMNIEENVLIEQFGERYQDYISKTKRLIPFIY